MFFHEPACEFRNELMNFAKNLQQSSESYGGKLIEIKGTNRDNVFKISCLPAKFV